MYVYYCLRRITSHFGRPFVYKSSDIHLGVWPAQALCGRHNKWSKETTVFVYIIV